MNKVDILKLAGVKSDKEFYKLFPDEKSFMAKYGKQVKKLQLGSSIPNNTLARVGSFTGGEKNIYNPINYQDVYDNVDYSVTGSNKQIRMDEANLAAQQEIAKNSNKKNGLFDMLGQFAGGLDALSGEGGGEGIAGAIGEMRYGGHIQKAENGFMQSLQNFGNKTEAFGQKVGQGYDKVDAGLEKIGGVAGGIGAIKDITEGIQMINTENYKKNLAEQSYDLSNLTRQASQIIPEQTRRNYLRPEDQIFNPGEMNQQLGVGTNVLARNGSNVPKAMFGMDKMAGQAGNQFGSLLFGGKGEPTGAGQVGSTIGGLAGKFIPIPGADIALSAVGGIVGSAIGAGGIKDARRFTTGAERNLTGQAFEQGARGAIGQYSQFAEYGTSVPNMAMGGDLKTHWGGYAEPISYNHHLPNNGETVMFRGKSHEESDGKGNTGIGITYGDSPVEVERGEPALQLKNGSDGSNNLTVYGNLKIPNYGVDLIGDPKAKGKKFKNYVSDLTRVENNQNKLMSKSVKGIDSVNESDPYDKLSLASYKSNVLGANMKLKDIAEKKINAANLQSAINDTAVENNLVADSLAKGKVKVDKKAKAQLARFGKNILKAQVGINEKLEYKNPGGQSTLPYNQMATEPLEYWKDNSTYSSTWTDAVKDLLKNRPEEAIQYFQNYEGPDKEDVIKTLTKKGSTKSEMINNIERLATDKKIGPYHEGLKSLMRAKSDANELTVPDNFSIDMNEVEMPTFDIDRKAGLAEALESYKDEKFVDRYPEIKSRNKDGVITAINEILPYLRPSDAEALNPNQLAGEMYALSTNQLEPVQAQTYQPELSTPYDISFQDQLNTNQDDYRAAQRMAGYNPAALAMLNSQKYAANQQVLGEQFRANQAMRDRVYGENRQSLNQAKLQNLGIYDQQYQRQEQAKSNTKATTQAALNSIASKFAQNELKNRKLGIYENMYNYRFDDRGRLVNMNPLQQFNTGVMGNVTLAQLEEEVNRRKKEQKETKTESARNGAILKAFRS